MDTTERTLSISMFGELTFICDGNTIQFNQSLGKHLKNLLEILVYYRLNPLSKEQLIDLMWSESLNPTSALKFSIFRLRQILENIDCLKNIELIVTTKNGYGFNPNLSVNVDTEEVDRLWKLSNDNNITRQQKQLLLQNLVDKVNQPFLSSSLSQMWTMSIREYYANLYNRSVTLLLEDMEIDKNYAEMMQLAQTAIKMDAFNEGFHFYYLLGLIETKQYRKSIEYYEQLNRQFYKEFNAQLSLKTKSLYNMILSREEVSQVSMGDLIDHLQENIENDGAFFCEYEVYKRMYQIALRSAERNKEMSYVMLMEAKSEENDYIMQKLMDKLQHVIYASLRKGDIFSRMNPTQYILLLPCQTEENAHMIASRIQQTFYKKNDRNNVRLHYHISSLIKN